MEDSGYHYVQRFLMVTPRAQERDFIMRSDEYLKQTCVQVLLKKQFSLLRESHKMHEYILQEGNRHFSTLRQVLHMVTTLDWGGNTYTVGHTLLQNATWPSEAYLSRWLCDIWNDIALRVLWRQDSPWGDKILWWSINACRAVYAVFSMSWVSDSGWEWSSLVAPRGVTTGTASIVLSRTFFVVFVRAVPLFWRENKICV